MKISKYIKLHHLFFGLILLGFILSIKSPREGVYFLDVGQGDSVYVTSMGVEVLIDGGPDRSALYELRKIRRPVDRFIDLVLVTHSHADHVTGLIYLLREYKVGMIVLNPSFQDSALSKELKLIAEEKDIKILSLFSGQELNFGIYNAKVIWPRKEYKSNDPNDLSVSIKLSDGVCKFLLTGDLEASSVGDSLFLSWLEDINVVKVPHHGSSGALPKTIADHNQSVGYIISVGSENRHGHPSLDVVSSLKGKLFFRTDENGTILVHAKGNDSKIVTL